MLKYFVNSSHYRLVLSDCCMQHLVTKVKPKGKCISITPLGDCQGH